MSKLNINICKACHNNTPPRWNKYKTKFWYDDNRVYCPNTPNVDSISTLEKAPETCPYQLEHLLKEKKK